MNTSEGKCVSNDAGSGQKLISFTIPCYGGGSTVAAVIGSIGEVMAEREGFDYEIVCVDDSSPDDELQVVKNLGKENSHIRVVAHARNFGKHAALLTAFRYSSGDYVVTVDDDGETPIAHLWELIDALEEGYDVAAAKYSERSVSKLKKLFSAVNENTTRILLGKPKGMKFSSFVARKRFVCDYIARYQGPYPSLASATYAVTHKIKVIEMVSPPRLSGSSGYTFLKGLKSWLAGCTTYSTVPLAIARFVGVFCLALSLISLIVSLVGGSSLVIPLILFLFGLVFLYLDLLGIYVSRTYMVANAMPQQVIRETFYFD